MENTLFSILRIIHILAGSVAFVVAPIAMIVHKGGKAHRRWGKVFFWAMTTLALMAAIMAPMHDNLFLLMLAVFSFYLAFSGYRALYRKTVYKTGKTETIDWVFAVLNATFSLGLLILGITVLPKAFGVIAIVFGALGSWRGIRDIVEFLRPSKDPKAWFFKHMIGMVTAYIAAVSAFSAVNMGFLPTVLQWLWPTLIGSPLLTIWIRNYKRKFSKGKRVSELVTVAVEAE